MLRVSVRFIFGTLAFPLADYLLFGLWCHSMQVALTAGACLMLFYLLVRPIVRLLLFAFNALTLGLLGTALDGVLILLTVRLFPGQIAVQSPVWAFLAAVIVNLVRSISGRLVKAG